MCALEGLVRVRSHFLPSFREKKGAPMPVSRLASRPVRAPGRHIVLFTVQSGDHVIVETLDAQEAIRQRASWDRVTVDFFEPATITMQEFAVVGEAVSA